MVHMKHIKGLGLCDFSSSLKFKSFLSAKNSLGLTPSKSKVLHDLSGGDILHGSEVYLTGMSTHSIPALKGFFVVNNNNNNKFPSKFWTFKNEIHLSQGFTIWLMIDSF